MYLLCIAGIASGTHGASEWKQEVKVNGYPFPLTPYFHSDTGADARIGVTGTNGYQTILPLSI